jgi:multiple sugar transport system permease protein
MATVVARRSVIGLAELARRPRRSLASLLAYGGLSAGLLLVVAPFAWMVLGSLKTREEMARLIPTWIPQHPTLDNYRVLIERLDLPLFFANSVLVASVVTVGNVIFCSMAGYALAKLRFPGRRLVFALVLATLLVPGGVTLIPSFILVSWLGLANTYAGLTLPFLAGAFGVFLIRQSMLNLPDELIDAARVDGASEYRIFWQIALPLSAPAVATLAILTFLGSWNGFLWPLVVAQSERLYTLPVALATFSRVGEHNTDFGLLMAGSCVIVLPILVVFVGLQRYITRGLAMTGLKG